MPSIKHITGLQDDLNKNKFKIREANIKDGKWELILDSTSLFQTVDMADHREGISVSVYKPIEEYLGTIQILGNDRTNECTFSSDFVIIGSFTWDDGYINYLFFVPTISKILVYVKSTTI